MKNRISIIVSLAVTIFSSFMLVYFSEGYYGIEFDLSIAQAIFNALLFILLSIVISSRSDCLFLDNNLIRLTRIASRRKAIFYELKKIVVTVFLFTFIETLGVLLFSMITDTICSIKHILLMLLFSFLVKLFFMILQFYCELYSHYKLSFLIMSILFLILITLGSQLYSYCSQYEGTDLASALEIVNRLNIANYVSLSRVMTLWNKLLIPIVGIIFLIIIEIVFIVIRIKKLDILSKE